VQVSQIVRPHPRPIDGTKSFVCGVPLYGVLIGVEVDGKPEVGVVYMPIPIGGLLTLLFIVEKIWLGEPPRTDIMYSDQAAELE
jgi:3'-phosphoadenosine 5'-phosphosulfate (PAPS) 3'-phosphatase